MRQKIARSIARREDRTMKDKKIRIAAHHCQAWEWLDEPDILEGQLHNLLLLECHTTRTGVTYE
jgi:hypothetical protein